ncbi:hypothetical protein CCHL11_07062 [Colletotrichum chlorophyti]|uniref:Peroxin 20 n=1 Tax=Colletotrichum chlorophyti TaxID=708187 RepID=A0A1Q8S3G7_9PEZI|nr:hypothetical protein CCHL11_07062 [Colletotrichum chlorophyti]
MADSSCSGSTPFKSLVEHGAQDRSLHQDRLSNAPGTQQSFRSSGSSSSPHAQAAFGAFLGTNEPTQALSVPSPVSGLQTSHIAPNQHARRYPPGSRSSAPRALTTSPITDRQLQAANSPPHAADWAQDFARFTLGAQRSGQQASLSNLQQRQLHNPVGFMHGMMVPSGTSFFGPMNGNAVYAGQNAMNNNVPMVEVEFGREMDRWMAAHGDSQIDDVDAIMEKLAQELEQDEQARSAEQQTEGRPKTTAHGAETQSRDVSWEANTRAEQVPSITATNDQQVSNGRGVTSASVNELDVLANGLVEEDLPDVSRLHIAHPPEATTAELAVHDRNQSEISQAAKQILESVQHEQGDKWKNSRFLHLMRDFRDGNKDIIDNEILETRAGGEPVAGI